MLVLIVNGIVVLLLSILVFIGEKLDKSVKIILVLLFIIVVIGADSFVFVQMNKQRGIALAKACAANQRVLLSAVEMYNMDHNTFMKKLDVDELLKPNK